jgi:hypothetical protein
MLSKEEKTKLIDLQNKKLEKLKRTLLFGERDLRLLRSRIKIEEDFLVSIETNQIDAFENNEGTNV